MNQTLGARLSPDLTGANVEDAGEHNRAVVLRCIHRQAPISRAEIARRTGFTKPAIARIVDRLLDEGLIMEARRRHGLRGQLKQSNSKSIRMPVLPSESTSIATI